MTRHLFVLATTLLLIAGAARASPVGIDPTGDASGPFGAASIVGDASTGADCYDLPPPLFFGCFPIFAVTGTGDASGGYVGASGTGDASESTIAISGTGEARGYFLSICASDPLACQEVHADVLIVTGVDVGPDNDGDGIPAHVDLQWAIAHVDGNSQTVTTEDMEPVRVRVDTNDEDPGSPGVGALPNGTSIIVPRGARVGVDQDGDGVPSDVTVFFGIVRAGFDGSFTIADGGEARIALDARDNDPNRPVARPAERIDVSIPTSAATGPDADGDGSPAFIEFQHTRITLDRTTGTVTAQPDGARTLHVDPDDGAREIHVNPDGDADATIVAFSATGDARSCEPRVTCVAISLTGDAEGYYAASGTGDATGCTTTHFLCAAASGTGDASSTDFAASGLGSASGDDAAVSALGPTQGTLQLSGANRCDDTSCVAIGDDGGRSYYLAAGEGDSRSDFAAVSLDGRAEGGLVAVSVLGEADGPLAVSGCDLGAC